MPKKILLADDSITIQKVIGLTFANEDVQLTVVDNGDEAMIKAKEIIPDLIIADVVMPGKDGYEVCYSTKADPNLQHIPVLLLTGTFETFDEAMATKVGADGFITKPFESQSLIDKVNELIGRAARRETPSLNDLAAAGVQAPSHDLHDPMNSIDSMDTMDAFEPVESLEPVEAIEPMEPMEPMELEEMAADEVNPMEEFASMTPDAAESSFADVTLDDAPAAAPKAAFDEPDTSFADFDLSSAEAETAPAPAPAPAASVVQAETPAPTPVNASPNGPAAGDNAGWNLSEFNSYMAESAAAAPVAAVTPEAPAPVAEQSEIETMETIDMEPAAPAPAEPMEEMPLEVEEPAAPTLELGTAEIETPAPVAEAPEISEVMNEPISAESDVWNTPQSAVKDALNEPAMFDESPASFAEIEPPAAAEEPPAPVDSSFGAAEEALHNEVPTIEEVPMEEPAPVAAAAPAPVEISEVDGSMELEPLAANVSSLQQVADMYPLDDAPSASAPAAPAFDEEKVLPPSVFSAEETAEAPREAPSVSAPPIFASAPGFSSEDFAAQSQRLSELIESRVRETLADDQVLSAFSERASRLVEAKIEEAINKVAPQVIEQLMKKAMSDATERILNETIGRLRNG